MFRGLLSRSSDKPDESSSTPKRKDSGARSQRKGSDSVVSTNSTRKSRGDDRDRGFNPSSTSYSSTTRSAFVGTAAPSIASSYATAQTTRLDDEVVQPNLVRNQSLADQMPRARSERDEKEERRSKNTRRRDRSSSRDRKGHRRDRSRSEERKNSDKKEKRSRRRNTDGDFSDYQGTTRAGEMEAFNSQIGGSGFTQFPGQYEEGMPGFVGGPSTSSRPSHEMSNHVPDMFPGQFPNDSAAPYRPPLAMNEGGPGLASEYYGDQGESVSQQPGVRPQPPSLIVGAEPHLMPASSVAAPPPEPSASGAVGAAASFFSGASFDTPSTSPKPPEQIQQTSYSTQSHPLSSSVAASQQYSSSGAGPTNHGSSGGPPINASGIVPSLGSAAIGAAAGYALGTQSSTHQGSSHNYQGGHPSSHQESGHSYPEKPPTSTSQGSYVPATSQPLPSQSSFYGSSQASSNRPPDPSKSPTHHSNKPYLAAAGAAGLAAAAYSHNHHGHDSFGHHEHYHSSGHYQSDQQYVGGNMTQRHRHRGPLSKVVDFFKDPEGVAKYEEYTEYIGVFKYCFEPGSTIRVAPRKHRPKKKFSNERLGGSTRVDKESRYWSSDGERHRRKNKSWLATGIAGYGLAQAGKTIFGNDHDFDDTYSVRTGRNGSSTSLHKKHQFSPDRKSRTSRGSASRHSLVEVEVADEGKVYKYDHHAGKFGSSASLAHSRRRSRSRSRSRDRKSKLATAAVGAVVGSAILASSSSSKKRHTSPEKAFVRVKHRSRSNSSSSSSSGKRKSRSSRHSQTESGIFGSFFSSPPPKRHSAHKKKKSVSFFNFGNSSSSSSDSALAFGGTSNSISRREKPSSKKINSTSDANAALIGLGAAATALAAVEARNGSKSKKMEV